MKKFSLNKFKVARLTNSSVIIGGNGDDSLPTNGTDEGQGQRPKCKLGSVVGTFDGDDPEN